jgi:hypothetical protein
MYHHSVLHVARQEEESRRQRAEIIATVYGGYAPMPKKWFGARLIAWLRASQPERTEAQVTSRSMTSMAPTSLDGD